ncbi:hypothetical protein AMTRI_Chr01g111970 [Amborella trichopoda]
MNPQASALNLADSSSFLSKPQAQFGCPAGSRETQFGYSNSSSYVPFSPSNHFGPTNPTSFSETRFVFSNSLPFSPKNIFYSVALGTQIGNSSESTEKRIVHSTSKGNLLFSLKNLVDSASFTNSSGTGLGYLNSNGSQGSSFQLEKRVIGLLSLEIEKEYC